jgi:hypothetical protein
MGVFPETLGPQRVCLLGWNENTTASLPRDTSPFIEPIKAENAIKQVLPEPATPGNGLPWSTAAEKVLY